ncbi:MAG: TatD family hydrolase [Patescibacteria group bacterium]|nr:TatD family hydrolase [Patescibacteria group bacterium]
MTSKYIDIHSHVNFKAFDEDRETVIGRALDNNIWMINVGTDLETSKKAIDIAGQYKKGIYATIGLHPTHTGEIFDIDTYLNIAKNNKVVAIGECGLDYKEGKQEGQKDIFIKHIELANEVSKPLMLHIREAYKDAIEILKRYAKVKGNVHFFAGTIEEAKQFLELGFTLSFTGVITFAKQYQELVEYIPLDMMMSETDCPFVTPIPYRGERNEPLYVQEVVKKIAEIKNMNIDLVKKQLVENAFKSFHF